MKKVFLMLIAVATITLVSCSETNGSSSQSNAEASTDSTEASAPGLQSPLELKVMSTSAALYWETVKPTTDPVVVTAGAEEGDSVAVEIVVKFVSGKEPKTLKAVKTWDLDLTYFDGKDNVDLTEIKCVEPEVLVELAGDKAEGAIKPVKFAGKWSKAEYIAASKAESFSLCINNQEVEE